MCQLRRRFDLYCFRIERFVSLFFAWSVAHPLSPSLQNENVLLLHDCTLITRREISARDTSTNTLLSFFAMLSYRTFDAYLFCIANWERLYKMTQKHTWQRGQGTEQKLDAHLCPHLYWTMYIYFSGLAIVVSHCSDIVSLYRIRLDIKAFPSRNWDYNYSLPVETENDNRHRCTHSNTHTRRYNSKLFCWRHLLLLALFVFLFVEISLTIVDN